MNSDLIELLEEVEAMDTLGSRIFMAWAREMIGGEDAN